MLFTWHITEKIFREKELMELSRRLGIGIVMIIPSFVGGGAMWEFFNSWGPVILWIVVVAIIYGVILYKGHSLKN
jgi:hypothetical protein